MPLAAAKASPGRAGAGADRDHLGRVGAARSAQQLPVDAGRAQQAPADRVVRAHCLSHSRVARSLECTVPDPTGAIPCGTPPIGTCPRQGETMTEERPAPAGGADQPRGSGATRPDRCAGASEATRPRAEARCGDVVAEAAATPRPVERDSGAGPACAGRRLLAAREHLRALRRRGRVGAPDAADVGWLGRHRRAMSSPTRRSPTRSASSSSSDSPNSTGRARRWWPTRCPGPDLIADAVTGIVAGPRSSRRSTGLRLV